MVVQRCPVRRLHASRTSRQLPDMVANFWWHVVKQRASAQSVAGAQVVSTWWLHGVLLACIGDLRAGYLPACLLVPVEAGMKDGRWCFQIEGGSLDIKFQSLGRSCKLLPPRWEAVDTSSTSRAPISRVLDSQGVLKLSLAV